MQETVGSGANTMNGLSFSIEDPNPLRQKARGLAMEDALSELRFWQTQVVLRLESQLAFRNYPTVGLSSNQKIWQEPNLRWMLEYQSRPQVR